ncbi:MAG: R3H domain-containing nucleic acid-binding protein [Acidobacteriota bacterium]
MERRFFSGATLQQAILSAARHHNLAPERVAYTVREKKHGFVGRRRGVVIDVDPAQPEAAKASDIPLTLDNPTQFGATIYLGGTSPDDEADSAPAAAKAEPDAPDDASDEDDAIDVLDDDDADDDDADADDEDRGRSDRRGGRGGRGDRGGRRRDGGRGRRRAKVADAVIEDALDEAVHKLADLVDLEIEWEIRKPRSGSSTFNIEFSGDDSEEIVMDDGELLQAFEHLLPRMVRDVVGFPVPVRLDCDGYRAGIEEELMELARDTADMVRRSGRARTLRPMTAADRRIIHLTLADDEDVDTESEGRGDMKRVRIFQVR